MRSTYKAVRVIFHKELASYFHTPLAYVFLTVFLILAMALPFFMGGFLQRGQADLVPFFSFHPWLYLVLVPALTMRLWAEERKSGTIELLMTLPFSIPQLLLGKFFACWIFTGIALLFTMPLWLTVNYLGNPDNGVIAASYMASWLMAGGFVALGVFCSCLSKNQVIAFIFSVSASFVFVLGGTPIVLEFFSGWAPVLLLDAVRTLSVITHFDTLVKGLIGIRHVLFFIAMIVYFLWATIVLLQQNKAA